ncbi:F0F1 ATP synthase subunit B [Mycoplasmopsis felifaucium]|uniref:ATP synthase subunit b n=1 Tax=Mycoplasmopsis felifaucium TaxID=35768 RepID=A0ABZ2RSB6_9BACT
MNELITIGNQSAKFAESDIKTTLTEKFYAMFPSYPMLISTLIALVLVIVILWFLLHKPIKKAMKERQDYIQNNIDQAKATNDLSQQKLQEANLRLSQAYADANDIIKNAKVHGEKVIAQYTDQARVESKRILQKAKMDINRERALLLEESKNNIANTAVELARQIVKHEVSNESQEKIIESFLKDKNK